MLLLEKFHLGFYATISSIRRSLMSLMRRSFCLVTAGAPIGLYTDPVCNNISFLWAVLLRFFQILNHCGKDSSRVAIRHTAMLEIEGQWYAPVYLDSTHYCHDIVL